MMLWTVKSEVKLREGWSISVSFSISYEKRINSKVDSAETSVAHRVIRLGKKIRDNLQTALPDPTSARTIDV
jgi:hypothetical protein